MSQKNQPLLVVNAGRLAYGPAFDLQREIVAARKVGAVPDVLLFVEHPHVITLGRNGETKNLLASNNLLKEMNVEFHETDRGGDITYHGPGQIVGYPILDLTQHKRDVRWYVEQLEEVMIGTAADYGLAARRVMCRHGIWIDPPPGDKKIAIPANGQSIEQNAIGLRKGTVSTVPLDEKKVGASAPEVSPNLNQLAPLPNATKPAPSARHNLAQPGRAGNADNAQSAVGAAQASSAKCSSESNDDRDEEKLAALGVHLSRWVTSHGFAFNVSTDLRFFDLIVPCGLQGKRATSLERALGRAVSIDEARGRLANHFAEIFHADPESKSLAELNATLDSIISSNI